MPFRVQVQAKKQGFVLGLSPIRESLVYERVNPQERDLDYFSHAAVGLDREVFRTGVPGNILSVGRAPNCVLVLPIKPEFRIMG